MSDMQSDVGPELLLLVRQFLHLMEPVVQSAAAFAPSPDGAPGQCQQVWCPLCACAAMAAGQQHPLTAILAEHGSTLLALFHSLAGSGDSPATAPPAASDEPTSTRYEHITITVFD